MSTKKREKQFTWTGVEGAVKVVLADIVDSVLSATVCITVTAFSGNLSKAKRKGKKIK